MQTHFTPSQLSDPDNAESEAILRKCVHCGFCHATCPTYVLLGDELDSPRGRIYQIQNMLESGAPPTAETVKHVDRCLSCLSCMSTCPSGVNYMHLVDHARAYIEQTHRRPLPERALRSLLSTVLTRPWLFRASSRLAAAFAWAAPLAPGRLKGLMQLAPSRLPPLGPASRPGAFAPAKDRRMRVAMLSGCIQPSLAPQIDEATVRLLNRHGVEVVIAPGGGCCGALPHHLGKTSRAHDLARSQIEAWTREIETGGLDAIVITASGCGTTVKDYGFMFRDDPVWAEKAAAVSRLALDVTELLDRIDLAPPTVPTGLTVAYHSACSLQHGQSVKSAPQRLLARAGFQVVEPREAHLCCGSAGTYNMLQPTIAGQLRDRKVSNLQATGADVIAAGNIGCLTQVGSAAQLPVVHTVELLDWATGGPKPAGLR